MTVSSTSYSNFSQIQQTQRKEPPSSSDFASKLMDTSDIDGDSLLSSDELNIGDELFTSLDSNSDGALSSSELEEGISSQLEQMKNRTSSPQEFASFLTELGLEVPPPPSRGDASLSQEQKDTISDVLSNYDMETLTQEEANEIVTAFKEAGIQPGKELAQAMEEEGFDARQVGDMAFESRGEAPPSGAKGAGGSGGMGGSGGSSSDEEYDEADANQDGVVSSAEYAAYYGSSDENQIDTQQYTMDLVSTLMSALKEESNGEDIEISQFKDIMKMVNNETQEPSVAKKLNQFLTEL